MPYFDKDKIVGLETIKDEVRHNFRDSVSKPGQEIINARAATAQWEHSSFSDPGPDWNKLHIFDADGVEIAVLHQDGF